MKAKIAEPHAVRLATSTTITTLGRELAQLHSAIEIVEAREFAAGRCVAGDAGQGQIRNPEAEVDQCRSAHALLMKRQRSIEANILSLQPSTTREAIIQAAITTAFADATLEEQDDDLRDRLQPAFATIISNLAPLAECLQREAGDKETAELLDIYAAPKFNPHNIVAQMMRESPLHK